VVDQCKKVDPMQDVSLSDGKNSVANLLLGLDEQFSKSTLYMSSTRVPQESQSETLKQEKALWGVDLIPFTYAWLETRQQMKGLEKLSIKIQAGQTLWKGWFSNCTSKKGSCMKALMSGAIFLGACTLTAVLSIVCLTPTNTVVQMNSTETLSSGCNTAFVVGAATGFLYSVITYYVYRILGPLFYMVSLFVSSSMGCDKNVHTDAQGALDNLHRSSNAIATGLMKLYVDFACFTLFVSVMSIRNYITEGEARQVSVSTYICIYFGMAHAIMSCILHKERRYSLFSTKRKVAVVLSYTMDGLVVMGVMGIALGIVSASSFDSYISIGILLAVFSLYFSSIPNGRRLNSLFMKASEALTTHYSS